MASSNTCLEGAVTIFNSYKLKQKDDDTIEDIEKHGPPMKVMWYLPIIPRMTHLFANSNDAKNLRWHADERKCDGMYRHQDEI